jgi:hypothetical protein
MNPICISINVFGATNLSVVDFERMDILWVMVQNLLYTLRLILTSGRTYFDTFIVLRGYKRVT